MQEKIFIALIAILVASFGATFLSLVTDAYDSLFDSSKIEAVTSEWSGKTTTGSSMLIVTVSGCMIEIPSLNEKSFCYDCSTKNDSSIFVRKTRKRDLQG